MNLAQAIEAHIIAAFPNLTVEDIRKMNSTQVHKHLMAAEKILSDAKKEKKNGQSRT